MTFTDKLLRALRWSNSIRYVLFASWVSSLVGLSILLDAFIVFPYHLGKIALFSTIAIPTILTAPVGIYCLEKPKINNPYTYPYSELLDDSKCPVKLRLQTESQGGKEE